MLPCSLKMCRNHICWVQRCSFQFCCPLVPLLRHSFDVSWVLASYAATVLYTAPLSRWDYTAGWLKKEFCSWMYEVCGGRGQLLTGSVISLLGISSLNAAAHCAEWRLSNSIFMLGLAKKKSIAALPLILKREKAFYSLFIH